ncbi:MAG: S8 family serine peptidase [Flammeovirgaceae bacterium]|nr:MAG: S8 family serine peptidase [Flammeovirgaceae bacterium]
MTVKLKWIALVLIATLQSTGVLAQTSITENEHKTVPDDWFLLDPETDRFQGVSAERVYNTLLKGKPARTVIVAVIDSGVDIFHEDLKDVIWVNTKEVPNNGIDDDKNGYVDDVYGWNFIGGKNGNVNEDTYELTREYVRLKPKFENIDEKKIGKKQQAEYAYWNDIKTKFEKRAKEATNQYNLYNSFYQNISFANDTLKKILKVDRLTAEMVDTIKPTTPVKAFAKNAMSVLYKNAGPDADAESFLEELKDAVHYYEVQALYGYNENFDSREIVGDDYSNPYERAYGNNDVKGPDAEHGTHVAGIIAANRNNNLGIKGIADNVKIMSVRAVPNGDERDKDVANAIYYAVDNGAHIINMSFGKSYSPQKEVVDKAVRYAESKGVLLVHAAGNDAKNSDEEVNYPSRFYKDGKECKTWVEIGASAWGADNSFVGSFSNYGKKTVDLFSPGVRIYSTIPEGQYKNNDGTSMASPATAGVAAILMAYFPDLSAVQVREILRQSTRKFDNLKVAKPGSGQEVMFKDLSITGGLVNAYEAVKLAMTISKPVEK